MNYNSNLVTDLEQIITTGLEQVAIPYERGNSIRLKHIAIRKHKNGYKLFDCKTNKHIVTVFSKSAALAVAKSYVEDRKYDVKTIINLDDTVNKHYMDALFARRASKIAKDEVRKETAEFRFDIAKERLWDSLENIERYIFDK